MEIHSNPNLVLPVGTQVVSRITLPECPQGAVGVIVRSQAQSPDLEFHRRECDRLICKLEAASQASHLPEAPAAKPALNDLLIRVRLGNHRSR